MNAKQLIALAVAEGLCDRFILTGRTGAIAANVRFERLFQDMRDREYHAAEHVAMPKLTAWLDRITKRIFRPSPLSNQVRRNPVASATTEKG